MICVSIGRGRHKHVIAEHAHLVQQGAQLVELRLDYVRRDVNLKRLIDNRPCPVIISCRRERDGGKWHDSEEARLMIIRQAIAEGVEYVDLEEDIADRVPRFGKTKRVVSLHDFTKTPNNLSEIHTRLCALDADVAKLSTMANNPHDNLRMLKLVRDSEVPTVGMCMGEIGTPSRILAAKFGGPFTYATFHHERALAPGQLSYRQMTDIYNYDQINKDTEIYGLIADPVGPTMSPIVYNTAFRELGLNKVYIPFRVPQQDLQQFLRDCDELGIKGLSAAVPHKEAIIAYCSKVDGAVKGIGAANTIVFDGYSAIGFNTDYRAAMDSLDAATGLGNRIDSLQNKTALVLGAGGAARVIAFGLMRRGAEAVIASRTKQRSQLLAQRLDCRVADWEARHAVDMDILVNATPVGKHPNVDETPFDKHYLRPGMVVFDVVYNPEQTLLVKEARQQHCVVVTGVDTFIRQAALEFQHFTGKPAPTDRMRDILKRTMGPVRY